MSSRLSCRTGRRSDSRPPPSLSRVTPSAVSEHFSELLGCPISRSLTTSCVCLEPRPLPSTGITQLQRYYGPLRHPSALGLSLTGVRLIIPDHALGLPVLRALSLCTCRRHYPGAADGRTRRSNSPIRASLPRNHYRVGLHIVLFEDCSAFTHVAACTLARSPNHDRYPKASDTSSPPCLLRSLPAGAVELLLGRWLGVSGLDSAGTGLFQAADRHAPLASGVTRLQAKRVIEALRRIESVASR